MIVGIEIFENLSLGNYGCISYFIDNGYEILGLLDMVGNREILWIRFIDVINI